MNPLRIALAPTRIRVLNIFLGLGLLVASALLLLALASYRASDPSLNTATAVDVPHAVRNWAGLVGAFTSDLLLQVLGLTSFLLPLVFGSIGWSWLRSRSSGTPMVRFVGLLLALCFVPTCLGLLPWHLQWQQVVPIEGLIGHLVSGALILYLNIQGAWLVSAVLAATGLYFAFAISFWLLKDAVSDRWQSVARLFDRFHGDDARHDPTQQPAALRLVHPAPQAQAEQPISARQPGFFQRFGQRHEASEQPAATNAAEASSRRRGGFLWDDEPVAETAPVAAQMTDEENQRSLWERSVADVAAPTPPSAAPVPPTAASDIPVARFQSEEPTAEEPRARVSPAAEVHSVVVPIRPQAGSASAQAFAAAAADAARQFDALDQPAQSAAQSAPMQTSRPQPVIDDFEDEVPDERPIAIQQRVDAQPEAHPTAAPRAERLVSGYHLPPSTLLTAGDGPQSVREEALREEARVLVEKCGEFDVRGQVVQINTGPMVTTYEFKPEAGVKYSRVTGLADDLCLAMRAESILIERMAGKSTVGIQVPNRDKETIHLRDIIESDSFSGARSRLTLAMGKDINGRIFSADLASMPHVLIAGSTGSGKSVAINAMIMSLLFRTTPQQVRLILVDPKRVELGMYEGVPHLFTPIITEPKLAANALRNAVREMERRLKLLASRSVRNIDQYNKLFDGASASLFDADEEPLPYIVIIIDELADLMMLDRANVEESITRLAQMARAVGIHLVLATQRPSVDVITGLIKANVPTRISFRLATKVDSRTILDTNGAESLLGRGDMLFLPPGTSRLVRLHAPYVSEKETAAVVGFWKAQGEAQYAEGFLESPKDERAAGDGNNAGDEDNDPLFDDAVRLVFEFGKASTSLLQRRLRIGYGRAAHLIDMMERDGLVGPADGSRPRELLKAPGWLHEVPPEIE